MPCQVIGRKATTGKGREEKKKEALPKARLQCWLDEAYQVMISIQDNLKGLQHMQWNMRLEKGPAIEKLVEEVQQEATQSTIEVAVI